MNTPRTHDVQVERLNLVIKFGLLLVIKYWYWAFISHKVLAQYWAFISHKVVLGF